MHSEDNEFSTPTVCQSRRGKFETLPPMQPRLERPASSFMHALTPEAVSTAFVRPDNLDVDDALMKKLHELLRDLKSLKCTDFASHLCDALITIVSGYKSLLFFAACSLLIFFMQDIQDYLVEQRKEAQKSFDGQLVFIGIVILITLIKALSGPASKSIITFCITILYHVNIDSHVSRIVLFTMIFFTDWVMDIGMSTVQVHFAATKFSRSLFLLLRLWVHVVHVIHPIFFVAWIVLQCATAFPGAKDSTYIRGAYASPLLLWSVLHILYKLNICKCLFFINIDNKPKLKSILIVPESYVTKCEVVLEQWSLIYQKYQQRDRPYSVLHGVLRLMKVTGVCGCCLKKRNRAEGKSVQEVWDEEPHALWKSFMPAWLWVYTAEFVLMLDAVFLVPYSWFRYYGVFMIAAVTLTDVDRAFTINYTLRWLDGAELDDTVRELLWFKVIKQPVGQLLGCVHVWLIWNDSVREGLYGGSITEDDLIKHRRTLKLQNLQSSDLQHIKAYEHEEHSKPDLSRKQTPLN